MEINATKSREQETEKTQKQQNMNPGPMDGEKWKKFKLKNKGQIILLNKGGWLNIYSAKDTLLADIKLM